jgi:hypothetical protein
MTNWESEIREAILRHGQFSKTCLEKDPVKRNSNNLAKNWRKKNPDKIKNAVEKWREKNPGKQSGYQKKWATKNPDYWKNYNKLHPEKKKEWNKRWREKKQELTANEQT